MVFVSDLINSILDFAILSLDLMAAVFAFKIMQRSERKLHFTWRYLFLAMLMFAAVKIVEISTEYFSISVTPLFKRVIELVFVVLVITAFWNMQRCIKLIDGKLISHGKIRTTRK